MSEESVEVVEESQPAPTPEVEAKPTVDEDWKSALPDDIRDNPNFAKYTSMESFAKGHLNAVSMLGKEPELKIPDNEDDRGEFFNKLGRPEEANGYKFSEYEAPEDLKEYINGREESFRETAHKIGLTTDQASELHKWYMEGNMDNAKSMEENRNQIQQEGFNNLKAEWGEAYDKNINMSQLALGEFADAEFVNYLEQTGLGDHPSMIKAFHNIAEGMIGEGKLEASTDSSQTPAAIDSKIAEIMANPKYWEEDSLERPALVREVQGLLERKHPEEART